MCVCVSLHPSLRLRGLKVVTTGTLGLSQSFLPACFIEFNAFSRLQLLSANY